MDAKDRVNALWKELISEALIKSNGCRAQAARDLGLERTTLLWKMKKLNIQVKTPFAKKRFKA